MNAAGFAMAGNMPSVAFPGGAASADLRPQPDQTALPALHHSHDNSRADDDQHKSDDQHRKQAASRRIATACLVTRQRDASISIVCHSNLLIKSYHRYHFIIALKCDVLQRAAELRNSVTTHPAPGGEQTCRQ